MRARPMACSIARAIHQRRGAAVTRTSTIATPTVLLSTLLLVGPALAADLPVRMPVKAPAEAPAPYVNWSGCYLGAHLGGAWNRTHFDDGFDGTPLAST